MLFELSKNKTLLSILSKADLDENTSKLVKSNANATEIKKSLIDNINSKNIVAYRKYILKAEEEEESLREREEKQTTDIQRKKLISLLAEKDDISEEEVDDSLIPEDKKAASRLIRELTREIRTQKDIGIDEEVEETSELTTDAEAQAKVSSSEDDKQRKLEKKKKVAIRSVNKAQTYQSEVKELVSKLDFSVENNKVTVNRLAEYQKFGNNITESNEVISLVMLYEGDENYLSNRYAELLENFGDKFQNVLLPYSENESGQMIPQTKKAIFVNNLDERWAELTRPTYKGVKLSDILKEMHRKRHGRQPIVDRKDKQRKEELQRLQRFITGQSPRDATKFKKLESKVKSIGNRLISNRSRKLAIQDKIKDLQGLDVEKIITRKIRQITSGISNLKGVKQLQEAMASVRDIRENPDKYIQEFTDELNEQIETEREKLNVIQSEIDKLEKMTPVLKRVRRALGQIDTLRFQTGNEPAGEVKRILGRLFVHVVRLERTTRKLENISNSVDDTTDDILQGLERGETINIGDIVDYDSVSSLQRLRESFDLERENIDSIMNEYDNLVGVQE
tara:strand:+ start:1185 stop:2882 length:1698 start_codon:yes stop_codon:yes gene_type:complete